MELSIFLAKLIGIYLLFVSAELILRKKELEKSIKDFSSSKGLLALSGSIALLFGLAIVIAHPIFTPDWQGLITLIGCLLIIRGALRASFPTHVQKTVGPFFKRWYFLILTLSLTVGTFLTLCGFIASP
jgi:hypothetical protein